MLTILITFYDMTIFQRGGRDIEVVLCVEMRRKQV
jgi:hypothetical protein